MTSETLRAGVLLGIDVDDCKQVYIVLQTEPFDFKSLGILPTQNGVLKTESRTIIRIA